MIYFPLFLSFTESSWEAAYPLVFIFDVTYQIVYSTLGTPQHSMASIYRLPKVSPSPTHAAALVTPPNLWWCTCCQYLCLSMRILTLDPIDINTVI